MVGLSVILENYRDLSENHHHHHHHHRNHVIRKGSCMIKSFSSPTSSSSVFSKMRSMPSLCSSASGFLEYCFLCRQKLLHGKDIYMYRGDRAFCSEECRYRHILVDEEEDAAAENNNGGCTIEYKYRST